MISPANIRKMITLPRSLDARIAELAAKDGRSWSAMAVRMLEGKVGAETVISAEVTVQPPRSCTACKAWSASGEWLCGPGAEDWGEANNMDIDDTEWPPTAPPCPAFEARKENPQ